MVAYAEVAAEVAEEASGIGLVIGMFLPMLVLIAIIVVIVVFVSRKNKEKPKTIVPPIGERSKWVGAILAFFLGGFGIHRYYLGYKKQGIMQSCSIVGLIVGYSCLFGEAFALAIPCFLYSAAMGIWAIADFVCILTGSLIPADGMPYKENRTPPQVQISNNSASDIAEAIAKLAKLHEQGILTDEEFQQKKSDLLAKM